MDTKKKESFFQSLRREFHELKAFYITDRQAEDLQRRTWLGRFFVTTFYILKAFYLRLSPVRRILFIVALFLLFSFNTAEYQSHNVRMQLNLNFWGGVLLIFLLLLELKDKLLIKDEILAARAIQEALIPDRTPQIAGFDIFLYYQPMNEVGGDLIDHIALNEEKHLLALADISGKGLSAALLMSKLQGFIHAFAQDTPFEQLMEIINQKFFYSVPRKSFASMLLLMLNKNLSAVRFLNAGHLPPLLWQNGQFTSLPKGGMALGLAPSQRYRPLEAVLNPGDVLVCYSDGLSEAFNKSKEQFGEERIKAVIQATGQQSAQMMGEALLQSVRSFIQDQSLSDDLSLIIVKKVWD